MRLQIVIKLTCKTAQIHDKRAEFHCSKKKQTNENCNWTLAVLNKSKMNSDTFKSPDFLCVV